MERTRGMRKRRLTPGGKLAVLAALTATVGAACSASNDADTNAEAENSGGSADSTGAAGSGGSSVAGVQGGGSISRGGSAGSAGAGNSGGSSRGGSGGGAGNSGNVAGNGGAGGGPGSSSLLLRADPTKRFLVDEGGHPFLVWGESAWDIGLELKVPAQNSYLDDRKAKGINAIQVMALSRYQDGDPKDADGVSPFTTPGDFATFNPTFFNKLANVVGRAKDHGMVVFLAPVWAGYDQNQGFYNMVVSNGPTKCQSYGAAIAKVFAPYDNIVWIMGGDKPGSFSTAEYVAMVTGIRSVDARHLITAHWNFAPTDAHPGPWEEIAGAYLWEGGTVYKQVQAEYQENDSPVIVLESLYELNTQYGSSIKLLRFQSMTSAFSGSKGYFFGHEGIWHFGSHSPNVPSQSATAPYDLDSVGMKHHQVAHTLLATRAWQDLVPDLSSELVTAGRGAAGSGSYVTAAKTPNGKLGMAYLPSAGTITVNLGQMTLPLGAKWFDPTNGKLTAAGDFSSAAKQVFASPGNNSAGDNDWVLVLESN